MNAGKTNKPETTVTNVLDELSLDEAKHYQEKTTKYIGRSLKSVTDPLFWYIMKTSNLVRGPWLHFYRFLCIKNNSGRLHVVELVSRAMFNIRASFERLINEIPQWTADAWVFASDALKGENNVTQHGYDIVTLADASVAMLLQSAAVFDRRVLQSYSRLARLLQIVLILLVFVLLTLLKNNPVQTMCFVCQTQNHQSNSISNTCVDLDNKIRL